MALEIANSPIPADAEKEYAGRWVAIRDGEVVAAAEAFSELVKQEGVRETDLLYHVPSTSAVI